MNLHLRQGSYQADVAHLDEAMQELVAIYFRLAIYPREGTVARTHCSCNHEHCPSRRQWLSPSIAEGPQALLFLWPRCSVGGPSQAWRRGGGALRAAYGDLYRIDGR